MTLAYWPLSKPFTDQRQFPDRPSLGEAAENGKQVTAVELARFDEGPNIA